MKITVTTHHDTIFVLDVNEDLDLGSFKVCCEIESGLPAAKMVIKFRENALIDDSAALQTYGLSEGDIVLLESKRETIAPALRNMPSSSGTQTMVPNFGFDNIVVPKTVQSPVKKPLLNIGDSKLHDPQYVRDLVLSNPKQLALLKQNNPTLADAVINGDIEKFKKILNAQLTERSRKAEKHKRILAAGPYDPEAQRLIAEEIRKENIDANMEAAMEYIPEAFGLVVMLYINCMVNGVPVKAFIDSGAQATLMSVACAERCNIMRLVDTRWAGVAKGVGVQKILGRVHMVLITIENDHLSTSFSVLNDQSVEMLLGLDMLRRHQCCIDLKKNVLHIGTTGTETRFLAEAELPSIARLSQPSDEMEPTAEEMMIENINVPSTSGTMNPVSLSGSTTPFPEELINEIVNFGFSRSQVIEELQKFNGDKIKTMASLFSKSFKF